MSLRLSRREAFAACAVATLGPTTWALPRTHKLPGELVRSELSLRGQQRFRFWGFEVYDAILWTAPGFDAKHTEAHLLALELHYLRDFQAKDIADRSIQEMRQGGSIAVEQEARWMEQMLRILPDVRQGDCLLGLQRPREAAVFWHNGQPRGEVRDAEFVRRFFGIWLSPQTSKPALRRALLGGVS